jgi:prepilin-type N-terminal cleavage/methylation domain-containing protein
MKMKRGYSLIELIISMSLFAIFSTIIIVSFVSFANIQGQTATMKESQQKLRVALDGIVRQTKEADKVKLESNKKLILYFGTESAVIYEINPDNKLIYRECNMNNYVVASYKPCTVSDINTYTVQQDLLSSSGNSSVADIFLDTTDEATKPIFSWQSPSTTDDSALPEVDNGSYNNPPTIKVSLRGKIANMNKYYGDNLTLETYVTLEPK